MTHLWPATPHLCHRMQHRKRAKKGVVPQSRSQSIECHKWQSKYATISWRDMKHWSGQRGAHWRFSFPLCQWEDWLSGCGSHVGRQCSFPRHETLRSQLAISWSCCSALPTGPEIGSLLLLLQGARTGKQAFQDVANHQAHSTVIHTENFQEVLIYPRKLGRTYLFPIEHVLSPSLHIMSPTMSEAHCPSGLQFYISL